MTFFPASQKAQENAPVTMPLLQRQIGQRNQRGRWSNEGKCPTTMQRLIVELTRGILMTNDWSGCGVRWLRTISFPARRLRSVQNLFP